MYKKAQRITSIALIFILIIPLFTVFNPEIPKAYAPPLVFTSSDPIQDGNTELRMPATYDKRTGNNDLIRMTWCLAANCGVDEIERSFVEWNITDLFNTTVVSVMFIYEATRHDAGTYSNVTSLMDTRPSITIAQTLFDAIGDSPTDGDGDGNFYYNDLGQDPTFPVIGVTQNITLNAQALADLQASIDAEIEYFAIGFTIDAESGATESNLILNENNPAGPTPNPTLRVEYYGGQVCVPDTVEILNPSAVAEDDTPWVYTEEKFYLFNASYDFFDLEGGDEASIRFSPDGVTDVTVTYSWLNDVNGLFSVSDPANFVTVPSIAENVTNVNFNSTTNVLVVIFPIWFTDNSPDAQDVDIFLGCTGFGFLDSGEDFHIYNEGGLIESEVTGNASLTAGGDIFEMCAYESGTARVNVTFRKIQSLTIQNAVRFFDNASGVGWTPEDQYMQDGGHQAGGEKASDPLDWLFTIRAYGYDNVTSGWVILNQIRYWMIEGDEGADDEWIALFNQWSDQDGLYRSQTWNAFIEEEPAARFRLWTDVWVNKANASSVLGGRTTAYYFGMVKEAWLLWGDWRPFLKNVTESMAFTDLKDGNGNVTIPRNYDLMKIEVFLERPKTKAGEENFLICLEDFNILEFKLSDKSSSLSGVNTPIFEETKVPDMPQTGVLAPLYAALLSLGTFIADVVSGGLTALWGMIDDRFPWFTAFWEGLLLGITDLATIFVRIFGWLSQLFAWGVNFIGLIATPITIIEGAWINIVDATASFAGVAPTDLGIVFIVMFGIMFPLEALARGDASVMLKVLELTWAVARTFIFLMMRIGTFIVNTILELIPF